MTFFKEVLGRITCTPFVNFYHYYGNCDEPEECLKWASRSKDRKSESPAKDKNKINIPELTVNNKSLEVSLPTTSSATTPSGDSAVKKRRMSDFLVVPKTVLRRGSECAKPSASNDTGNLCKGKSGSSKGIENLDVPNPGQSEQLKGTPDKNGLSSSSSRLSPPPVEERREPRDARYEWFFVAEILDKTLFLLFFLTMMTTVLVSLVVVPWIHG